MLKRLLLPLLLLLAFAVSPAAGEPYGISTQKLSNGLEVIAIRNSTVPLVTIEIAVKNGAFTESPEYDGLSHLYEHMFFKGNKAIPNQEAYIARTRELGMVFNGTTGDEVVQYFFTMHKDNLRAGLVFMKNAIRFPLFNKTELDKEREVVLSEYDRNESQPFFHLWTQVEKALWRGYYSRKNTLGNREIIQTTTPEKMRTIQHRYYIPNNAALLVSGDIDPKQVFQMAAKIYGDWPAGENPFKKYPIPDPTPLPRSHALIVNRPIPTARVLFEWMGPSVTVDPRSTYAADAFSYILRQPNSTFYKHLVDSGLAVQAAMDYSTQAHVGPIYLQLIVPPAKIKDAVSALYREMSHFTDPDYYTDEQLADAKTLLKTGEIYDQEKPSQFVHTVAYWWSVAGLNYYFDYVSNLQTVTRQDIDHYLHTYILGKPFVVGALLSAENQKKIDLKQEDLLP